MRDGPARPAARIVCRTREMSTVYLSFILSKCIYRNGFKKGNDFMRKMMHSPIYVTMDVFILENKFQ